MTEKLRATVIATLPPGWQTQFYAGHMLVVAHPEHEPVHFDMRQPEWEGRFKDFCKQSMPARATGIDASELKFQVKSTFTPEGVLIPGRFVRLIDMTPAQRQECLTWCESVMTEPWFVKTDHTLQIGMWTEKVTAAAAWLKAHP